MIFRDIIQEKGAKLRPIFNKLLDLTLSNQTHSGDLLLVSLNGFFNPEVLEWTDTNIKYLPYSIGIGKEGRSEYIHFNFIDSYRKSSESRFSFSEYLQEIDWVKEKKDYIERLIFQEELSIQLEMLIYLKIWESDAFIKRFYQLARITNNQNYDWHFKISDNNREKNSTGSRWEIIRKKTEKSLIGPVPELALSFSKTYNVQLRNSIAHSQYSFLSRYIHLNNYKKEDKFSQLKAIKFNEWIDLFHETLVIYNEYVRLLNRIHSYYSEIAKTKDNQIEVKIGMEVPCRKDKFIKVEYRPEWDDFKINNGP